MPNQHTNNQVRRIIAVLQILQGADCALPLNEIQQKFPEFGIAKDNPGQTLRNIQRDIQFLREIGFHIKNKRKKGYFLQGLNNRNPLPLIQPPSFLEGIERKNIGTARLKLKRNNFLNKIINGDCLKVIPAIPDASIDLLITSVPYNFGKKYDVYNDAKFYSEYIIWLERIFHAVYPKIKKGGRVCINVSDGKNGRIHTHVDVEEFMVHKLGYLALAQIVWNKEYVSNRYSWGTFKSPKSPSLPSPFEYILVYAKESLSLQEKGKTDLTKQEFIDWSLAMWAFPKLAYKESGLLIRNNVHPAPFPEDLPIRLIKMFSWVGATVLDPFCGVGTTLIACKKLGRKYIGIELSETYCEFSKKRLKEI